MKHIKILSCIFLTVTLSGCWKDCCKKECSSEEIANDKAQCCAKTDCTHQDCCSSETTVRFEEHPEHTQNMEFMGTGGIGETPDGNAPF